MKKRYNTPKKSREREGSSGGALSDPSSTQTTPSISDTTPLKEDKQIAPVEVQSKLNRLIVRAESLMAKLSSTMPATSSFPSETKVRDINGGSEDMSTRELTFQLSSDTYHHVSPKEMEVALLLEGLPEAYEDPFHTYVNNEYVDNVLHSVGQYLPNQLHFKSFAVYNQEVMERLRQVRYLQIDVNSLLVYSTKFGVQFDSTFLLIKYVHHNDSDPSDLPIKIDLTEALEAKLKQKYRVNLKSRSSTSGQNSSSRLLNKYFSGTVDLPNTYITLPIRVDDNTIQRWLSGVSHVQIELWSYIHTTHSVKRKGLRGRKVGGKQMGSLGKEKIFVEEGERVAHCIPFATTKVYLSGLLYTYQDRTYNNAYREEGEINAAHHHSTPSSLPSPPSSPPTSSQHTTKNVFFDATINTELAMVPDVYHVVAHRYEVLRGVRGSKIGGDGGVGEGGKVMCGIMNVRMKLLSDGAYVQNTDEVMVVNSLTPPSSEPGRGFGRRVGDEGRPMLQPLAPPSMSMFNEPPPPIDPIQRALDFVPQETFTPAPLSFSVNPSIYMGMVFLGVQDVYIPPYLVGGIDEALQTRLVIMYRITKSTADSVVISWPSNQPRTPD
eukprot:gene39217-47720_t